MDANQIGLAQLVVGISALFVTGGGLWLIKLQIETATKIAKGQNTMHFLLGEHISNLRKDEKDKAKDYYDPNSTVQISPETVEKVLADTDCQTALRAKLNYYEGVATAILHGTLDEELYRKFGSRALRMTCWTYAHYISYMRQSTNNPLLYKQLEELALMWEEHKDVNMNFFSHGEVITSLPYNKLPVKVDLNEQQAQELAGPRLE